MALSCRVKTVRTLLVNSRSFFANPRVNLLVYTRNKQKAMALAFCTSSTLVLVQLYCKSHTVKYPTTSFVVNLRCNTRLNILKISTALAYNIPMQFVGFGSSWLTKTRTPVFQKPSRASNGATNSCLVGSDNLLIGSNTLHIIFQYVCHSVYTLFVVSYFWVLPLRSIDVYMMFCTCDVCSSHIFWFMNLYRTCSENLRMSTITTLKLCIRAQPH